MGTCCRRDQLSRGRVRHHNRQLADLRHKGDAGNGQKGEMAEMQPRVGLLAGEKRMKCGAVVGDGGAGVRGGTQLRGFIGDKIEGQKKVQ